MSVPATLPPRSRFRIVSKSVRRFAGMGSEGDIPVKREYLKITCKAWLADDRQICQKADPCGDSTPAACVEIVLLCIARRRFRVKIFVENKLGFLRYLIALGTVGGGLRLVCWCTALVLAHRRARSIAPRTLPGSRSLLYPQVAWRSALASEERSAALVRADRPY